MKRFIEVYKTRYAEVKASPGYARRAYAKNVNAALILLFTFLALSLCKIFYIFFGLNEYLSCAVFGFLALSLAYLVSEKMTDKKFGKK